MVMVAANETLKLCLNPTGEHNSMAYFVSGALSGALAGAITNPLDVAKTRLQTQMMVENIVRAIIIYNFVTQCVADEAMCQG